ncbi:LysR family transcriptional regulator [Geosporobacter ferrireducens]|uniref:LysR family transcriptional regulator n=1 Tax=Geosporobacter ferrireducens TaxID=1424294 RepID=UPI0009F6E4E8|nr:LysR family transcriptional regulator [Geosporobacter ferrireducens]MTI54694.1 LysR family transcriptional regulator [Geosporobacter ferrireducens]
MDSNDWIMLKTIRKEHSLSRTAERLFISQPSLTYRLNKLEKEFGVKILNRHSNGVSFTIQGEYLLKYAEEMLEKLSLVKDTVQNMKDSTRGTLRLGVSTVFAKFKLAPILKTYQERFPDVEIILKTGSSTLQLPDMLFKNDVDLIILRADIDWPEKKHVILEEPHGIISAHPIAFHQLPHVPWIQDDSVVITKFDEVFYKWWQVQFSTPPPALITQVNSLEACIQLASHGLGWTIVPKIHIGNRRSLFFSPLLWPDGQPMLQKTFMLYRNEVLERSAIKMFIDYVLDECISRL